jgi:2-polyprenyl-3-methyl-5-hydroxy-6-metoxy-1,4-benzoquinol methylase
MNEKHDLSFDYSSSYFQSGMDGWHASSYPLITETFKRFSQGRRFATGLDFGCGDGFYGHFLREYVDQLSGADISKCIEDAGNRSAYNTFTQIDLGQRLRAEGNIYDVIFSSEVIEHVSDYDAFLGNAYHLLKPNGFLFLTTTTFACSLPIYLMRHPKQWSIQALIQFLQGFGGDGSARTSFLKNLWTWTKGHYHGFSKRQLTEALGKVGFEIETLEYLHAQPFIDTKFFWNPFKGTKNRWFVVPVARVLGGLALIANFLCKELNIYAPNVVVIAKKPRSRNGCL